MHDRVSARAVHVYGAVDGESGRVHFIRGFRQLAAFDTALDQIGGGHFLEQQAVGIDQELIVGAGDAAGNVGAQHVGPAHHRGQAVSGRQFNARLPFLGADATSGTCGAAEIGGTVFGGSGCGSSCHMMESYTDGLTDAGPRLCRAAVCE